MVQVGNLKNCIESWRKITSDPITLSLHLFLIRQSCLLSHILVDEVKLMEDEVQKLVKKGALIEVSHCKNEFYISSTKGNR